MRLPSARVLGLLLAGLFVSSCDFRSPTGDGSSGSMKLVLPRLGSGHAIAGQTGNTDDDDIKRIAIRISVVRTGAVLLNRDIAESEFRELDDEVGDEAGEIEVRFPLPSDATSDEVYEVDIRAYDASNVEAYRIGPKTFTLGTGGRAATVEVTPQYTGPGSLATAVGIQLGATSIAVGQTTTVTCLPRLVDGTPVTVLPLAIRVRSNNSAIATTDERSVVTGQSAGSTQIVCELDFGNHATAAATISVTASGNTFQIIQGAGQTGPVSAALPTQIRVQLRNATSGLGIAGVTVNFSPASGTANPTSAVTIGDGTAATTWTLGSALGTQTMNISAPSIGANTSVTATAIAGGGGIVSGLVFNATTGIAITGATVELRSGSATTGPTVANSTTTAAGSFSYPNVPAGTYTLRVAASGFADATRSIVVTAGQTSSSNVGLSPTLGAGQVRFVLTWNAGAQGIDLDFRLQTPNGPLVYWNNNLNEDRGCVYTTDPFTCLEHDAIPEFGDPPTETIRIQQIKAGTYTLKVHNWSYGNRSATLQSLAQSGARVEVYIGSSATAAAVVNIPTSASGNMWSVLTFVGPSTVTVVNTVAEVSSNPDVPGLMRSTEGPPGLARKIREAAPIKR